MVILYCLIPPDGVLNDDPDAVDLLVAGALLRGQSPGALLRVAAAPGRLPCVRAGVVLRYALVPLVNEQDGPDRSGRIAIGHGPGQDAQVRRVLLEQS